jgi:hypothetical protein
MAVGADLVAAEHEAIEDDVARLGGRGGREQAGGEERGEEARHGAEPS